MTKAEIANNYFANNFNCSQSVFTTFATELGMEEELALKLSTQFGGGARCGEMCGAVSGALMVLGLKYGHCHAQDSEEKANAYAIAEEFMKRFKEANKSVVCRELLGYDLTKADEKAKIAELNLFQSVCPKMIESATVIVEQMLKERE